jgi:hypothetical protein
MTPLLDYLRFSHPALKKVFYENPLSYFRGVLIASLVPVGAVVPSWTPPQTADRQPDLQGILTNGTGSPRLTDQPASVSLTYLMGYKFRNIGGQDGFSNCHVRNDDNSCFLVVRGTSYWSIAQC